jgi:proline dehydrogenase
MRRLLLWMSGNRWLRRRVPKLWITRRAVRKFMPGESVEDALKAADRFSRQGLGVLFTRLGETLAKDADAEAVAEGYVALVDEIARRDMDGELSVKPTQLGLDFDAELTLQHLTILARRAAPRVLWLDMEGSAYTDATIDIYERLKRTNDNVGICLQAYLKRTYLDLERLEPIAPRIRLVKGAYAEPAEIAWQHRREVDANYLALCVSMLEAKRRGIDLFLGLGTHDVQLIEQVADHAAAVGLPKSSFDVEMLYGIRADQQRRLARQGYRVRVLIAYGEAWYPWYMRRLAERPANVVFAIRQLMPF